MYKRINKSEAKQLLTQPKAVLVDIRDTESYNESHDNRSINLNNDNLASFMANTPKEAPVLVLCYHGNSSQSVASFLSEQGFTNTYSVDGGYEEWSK